MIVISYHPLLRSQAGDVLTDVSRKDVQTLFEKLTDSLPDGSAEACLWASNENGPFPVLLLEQGKEIVEHLVEWSEGEPESWFKLHVAVESGFYCLALMPDVQKSCDRQMAAWALASGMSVSVPDRRSIVFKPLRFVSDGPSDTFLELRGSIPSKMEVGVLDTADVPEGGPLESDPLKMASLGCFDVVWTESEYLRSMIREQIDESGPPERSTD